MAMLSPDVRIAAIRALSTRADAEAGAALSTLLQPYESLSVRIAAAQALDRLPCNDTCIQGVLHYLERTSHGELDYNQRQKNPPELDASMRARLARNEDKLNAGLYRALEQHPRETVAALQLVYGLGTLDPSEFGLNVLERVGIVQACPALRASALEMQGDVRFVDAPREKVRQLRESLGCQ
jgi:hypothetical protein